MDLSKEQLARASAAAGIWAKTNGNYKVAHKFNLEDATQEAVLTLLKKPEATVRELYCDVLDAAREQIPGYRQGKEVEILLTPEQWSELAFQPGLDDVVMMAVFAENLAYLRALPEREQLALWLLEGVPLKEVAARLGICAHTAGLHVRQLCNELLETAPRLPVLLISPGTPQIDTASRPRPARERQASPAPVPR